MEPQPRFPAQHWPLAQAIIYRTLVRPAARRMFSTIWLHCPTPPTPESGPLIACMSHVGWWDGYMLFLIDDWVLRSRYQNYIMMEERQLQAFRFFTWCGAFSLDRKTPGGAEGAIHYIAELLRAQHNRCLWIFPQGRIVPNDRRPVEVYGGIARVVQQVPGAWVWPIALRYEFRGAQLPEAFIRCGTPYQPTADTPEPEITAEVGQRLAYELDTLRSDVLNNTLSDYQEAMRGRRGIDQLTARTLERLRALRRRAP